MHTVATALPSLLTGLVALGILIAFNRKTVLNRIRRHYHRGGVIIGFTRAALGLIAVVSFIWALIGSFPGDFLLGILLALVLAALGGMLLYWHLHVEEQDKKSTVLVAAAHPDDLEIACGATIAAFVDRGHDVYAVVMSDGSQGGDAAVRRTEAEDAARFLGVTNLTVHSLPDRNLSEHSNAIIGHVEEKIIEVNPDLILTHSNHDIHQDHAAVHEAVLRAARNHHSILCFESPSVTKDFKPSVFIDVTGYSDVKNLAMAAHDSQMKKPYMTRDIVDGTTSFRGRQARCRHAEGFEPVRLKLSNPLPF